jgi:hypothetical protein
MKKYRLEIKKVRDKYGEKEKERKKHMKKSFFFFFFFFFPWLHSPA